MNGFRCTWLDRAGAAARPEGSLLERVLAARGVAPFSSAIPDTPDHTSADAFLNPRLSELHDPSLIPDLDRAAERLLDALYSREPIVIYGDYDADGITAAAILFHVLHHLAGLGGLHHEPGSPLLRTYVPHRLDEGYGLNPDAIASLAADGARVVVSVDCGVTSVLPARRALELGIDLIITDHHTPPASLAELPEAFAVVHPRRPDSKYPFPDLCGAGVAYKLAWRLATLAAARLSNSASPASSTPSADRPAASRTESARSDPSTRELLIDLLSLAALGTIADVVPLLGENRVIARFGLSRLRHVGTAGAHARRFLGLQALIDAAGLSGESISAVDVGFKLAPRLNAAGRLGHARSAVELLTIASHDRATTIAGELSTQNDQRRALERQIFEQACERAESAGMTRPGSHAIVLADPNWHQGVVGIVCSRLVERYRRPAILLSESGDLCQGSGRSIDGFSLHDALSRFAHLFERFGGHDMAAGLAIRRDRLDRFAREFIEFASAAISPDLMTPRLHIDTDATIDELSIDTVQRLDRIGPFGRDNPAVRVRLRGVRLAAPPRAMGTHARHLSFVISRCGPGGGAQYGNEHGLDRALRVVAWNWAEHAAAFRTGRSFDVVIEPKVSTWNGSTHVEAELVDASLE